ncbi:hypothetical protein O3M35_012430 [Rhynocoris fuscipes]|uniref:Uncharacterized protein n=1 Tax=Rhynocoris fuscipes TaxID=488301 RepID=A0AAW1CZN5_9HEMI
MITTVIQCPEIMVIINMVQDVPARLLPLPIILTAVLELLITQVLEVSFYSYFFYVKDYSKKLLVSERKTQ